jgi:hypothetical protein
MDELVSSFMVATPNDLSQTELPFGFPTLGGDSRPDFMNLEHADFSEQGHASASTNNGPELVNMVQGPTSFSDACC